MALSTQELKKVADYADMISGLYAVELRAEFNNGYHELVCYSVQREGMNPDRVVICYGWEDYNDTANLLNELLGWCLK